MTCDCSAGVPAGGEHRGVLHWRDSDERRPAGYVNYRQISDMLPIGVVSMCSKILHSGRLGAVHRDQGGPRHAQAETHHLQLAPPAHLMSASPMSREHHTSYCSHLYANYYYFPLLVESNSDALLNQWRYYFVCLCIAFNLLIFVNKR